MRHLTYLALLAGCLLGTAPLEIWLRTRVYARPRRWLLSLLPVFVVFTGWDLYAIARGHWSYDRAQTSGIVLLGRIPLEEVLFFLVVPTCAILAFEAVRAVKGWPAGDEPDDAPDDEPDDSAEPASGGREPTAEVTPRAGRADR